MSHQKPHLRAGLCECDCRKCTVLTPAGHEICICKDCNARKCGMHDGTLPPEASAQDGE